MTHDKARAAFGFLAVAACALPFGMALAAGQPGAALFWVAVAVVAADIASS